MAGARKSTARRYAEAIFEIAERDGKVEAWLEPAATDRRGVSRRPRSCARLEDPNVPIDERRLRSAARRHSDRDAVPQMRNLLALIVRRRRVESLSAHRARVSPPVQPQAGHHRGDCATSAARAGRSGGSRASRQRLEQMTGGKVELSTQGRPSLLGRHPGPPRRPADRRQRPWPSRTTAQPPRVRRPERLTHHIRRLDSTDPGVIDGHQVRRNHHDHQVGDRPVRRRRRDALGRHRRRGR